MNRYLAIIIALLASGEMNAFRQAPRLVVNITIDQLRSDLLETFSPQYGDEGFNKLFQNGAVFKNASFPFSPVDIASASAAIATGTSPYYNGIIASRWLDKNTLRPTLCISDSKYYMAPTQLLTSTIGDELKAAHEGKSIVWSIAERADAAILSAGHAADGAIWLDNNGTSWKTSTYYSTTVPAWVNVYSTTFGTTTQQTGSNRYTNELIANLAIQAVKSAAMGLDNATDYLSITLSASPSSIQSTFGKDGAVTSSLIQYEDVYRRLDSTIGTLVSGIEKAIGSENVLFVLTSTGYETRPTEDLSAYRIPTGTLNISRTVSLLNMYLSAIYGQGRYAQACFGRNIYIDHKLLEQKHLNPNEVLQKAQEFLIQTSGVSDVFTKSRILANGSDVALIRNGYNAAKSGDILIEIAPGWQLLNEETQETIQSNNAHIPFPIIFYGAGIEHQEVKTPVTTDMIAPTIASCIHIRAPNACKVSPLF